MLNLSRSYGCALLPPRPRAMINNVVSHVGEPGFGESNSWARYLAVDDVLDEMPPGVCTGVLSNGSQLIYNRYPTRHELTHIFIDRTARGGGGGGCIPQVKIYHTSITHSIFWNGNLSPYLRYQDAMCRGTNCPPRRDVTSFPLSSELLRRTELVVSRWTGSRHAAPGRSARSHSPFDDKPGPGLMSAAAAEPTHERLLSPHSQRPALSIHVRRGDAKRKRMYPPGCDPSLSLIRHHAELAVGKLDNRTRARLSVAFIFTDETEKGWLKMLRTSLMTAVPTIRDVYFESEIPPEARWPGGEPRTPYTPR